MQTKKATTEEGRENEKFIEEYAETILKLGNLSNPIITKVEEIRKHIGTEEVFYEKIIILY